MWLLKCTKKDERQKGGREKKFIKDVGTIQALGAVLSGLDGK